MNANEMWNQFCLEKGISLDSYHEAWQFGSDPDKLARLVMEGKKTATASGYDLYVLDPNERVPGVGDYSVILDSHEEAVCLIRTVRTCVCLFDDVSAEHARKEGEGDLSLSFWRNVHEAFFKEEYEKYGLKFDRKCCKVLCEEFELEFPDVKKLNH